MANDDAALAEVHEQIMKEYREATEAYTAERDSHVADGRRMNPAIRKRKARADEDLLESRRYWRNIGAAVGDRPVGANGQAATGVKVENHDGSVA